MEVTRGTADQSGHSNLEQEKGNYHLLIPALCREPPSCGSDGEESACNAGDLGLIWVGNIPGEGNGNPLQYSCLENSWTVEPGGFSGVHGVTKNRT